MESILFALATYVFWGSGDIFGTIVSRKIGGYQTAFWYFLLVTPIYLISVIIFPEGLQNLSLGIFLLTAALGVVAAVSMITFYESLRQGSASLMATISAAFPAIVVPLSIIFLGEHISGVQLSAIVIILLGVVFSTLDFKELKGGNFKLGSGVVLALVTMFLWGIYWTFIKIPINQIGWAWPNLLTISALITIVLYTRFKKIRIDLSASKKLARPMMLNSLFLGVGAAIFNYAITKGGNVAIITPIAASYPTLYVIIASFVFKDKVTKKEVVGILITLAGIVTLSLTTI